MFLPYKNCDITGITYILDKSPGPFIISVGSFPRKKGQYAFFLAVLTVKSCVIFRTLGNMIRDVTIFVISQITVKVFRVSE